MRKKGDAKERSSDAGRKPSVCLAQADPAWSGNADTVAVIKENGRWRPWAVHIGLLGDAARPVPGEALHRALPRLEHHRTALRHPTTAERPEAEARTHPPPAAAAPAEAEAAEAEPDAGIDRRRRARLQEVPLQQAAAIGVVGPARHAEAGDQ